MRHKLPGCWAFSPRKAGECVLDGQSDARGFAREEREGLNPRKGGRLLVSRAFSCSLEGLGDMVARCQASGREDSAAPLFRSFFTSTWEKMTSGSR